MSTRASLIIDRVAEGPGDAGEGRMASLARWHLACAGIQIACLGLDRTAGVAVLSFGLMIRLGLVIPLYVAGACLLARGPRALRMPAIVLPMVAATGAVAFLGALAPPPFSDRYTMAAGMIPLLGVILMPVTFREAALLTGLALPVYAGVALADWGFGPAGPVADLVIFMSGLVTLGLLVRHRLAKVEQANLQFQRRERERAEELATLARRLEVLSATDPLTGIANRRGFDLAAARVYRECVEAGTSLGLLMVDVDHFKSFNDVAGHLAGDQCLRALVSAITASCRLDSDEMARFGGEEFIVLLPGLSPEETEFYAERLRRAALSAAIPHPGRGGAPVTVSVGAAALRPTSLRDSIDDLVARADAALYDAKAAGRNRIAMSAPRSSVSDHDRRADPLSAAA